MEPRIIKEKWELEYTLGPNSVPIRFRVQARGRMDARAKGEKVMAKEWGASHMSWHFVGAKTIENT